MNRDTKRVVCAIAAGVVMVGSVLPWATVTTVFGSISKAGTEGDGIITLVGGAIAAILSVVRQFILNGDYLRASDSDRAL